MLSSPRGPLSEWVVARMLGRDVGSAPPASAADPFGDDLQMALYVAYEVHYSDLPGVASEVEWDPEMIRFRASLEGAFARSLVDVVGPATGRQRPDVREAIPAIIAADDGPSLSTYMEREGTLEQMRDAVLHRSPYQLKEADPHTFAIPRLRGRAKQLLVQIQTGEYGADTPGREMHSTLFAQTMSSLGLDPTPNAHLDILPGTAMMVSNLISLFGLNRRWRGALVGHLAVFELTSVAPMARYSRALARMDAPPEARRFYDVHVLADAEHEVLALNMAAEFVADEPSLLADVLFGARAVNAVEAMFAATLLRGWDAATRARPQQLVA
jgi:hypothetical protein